MEWPLKIIPAEYFKEPFETWTGKLQVPVLASTRTVPVSTNTNIRGGWPQRPMADTGKIFSVPGYLSENGTPGQRDRRFRVYR